MDIDKIQVGGWYKLARPSTVFEGETRVYTTRVRRKITNIDHLTNDRVDQVEVDVDAFGGLRWLRPASELIEELPGPWYHRLANLLRRFGQWCLSRSRRS